MKPAEYQSPAGATEDLALPPVGYGETRRIGPDCFADKDETVICWRGRNYVLQEEPEAVHICGDGCTARHDYAEGPEDAARRYAQQLLALQHGLRQRQYDMTTVTEDDLVQFALDALDEKAADREFDLNAAVRVLCEDELLADLGAEIVRQDRIHPVGYPANRDGLRLGLAAIEDEWLEAHAEWRLNRKSSQFGWGDLEMELLQTAAVAMRVVRSLREAGRPD